MERNMVKAASFCLVLLVALVTAANAQVAQPSPQPVMPPIMPLGIIGFKRTLADYPGPFLPGIYRVQ